MATVSIDILLDKLEQLRTGIGGIPYSDPDWLSDVKFLHDGLVVLRSFVEQSQGILYVHAKVKNLVPRIRDLADKAEAFILRHIFGDSEQRDERRVEIFDLFKNLNRIREAIDSMNSGLAVGKRGTVCIDLLLEWFEQLVNSDIPHFDPGEPINKNLDSFRLEKVEILHEKLECFGRLVKQPEQKLYARWKAKILVPQIRDVVDEAEIVIIRYLFSALEQSRGRSAEILDLFRNAYRFNKEIDSIISELVDMYGLGETATVSIDILLEKLKQLIVLREPIDNNLDSFRLILDWLIKVKILHDQLELILDVHEKVINLVPRIREVADEAELIINWHLFCGSEQRGTPREKISRPFRDFYLVREKIYSIPADLQEIYGNKIYGEIYGNKIYVTRALEEGNYYDGGSSRANIPVLEEEVMVGFDDEAEKIKVGLARDRSRLEVLSVVGMAGLGKTTLARKVYNDSYIAYHFYVRAWTYVSQVYQKRAVLLGILSCLVEDKEFKDKITNDWSAERMEADIYRRLKGKRYLIVMDDIWKIEAWDDLNKCFPNDNNGSRILFTTRHMEVALYPKHNSIHPLRFLNHNESLKLIEHKVFGKEKCSPELVEIGKQIAEKCQGLPLPIVVVAGVLAKEKKQDWWKQVAKSVSSFIISDPMHIIDTLALSYNHLPPYLKPCFLYFGLFPENYEIPVKKLIWLWVAEGFVKKNGQKCVEDVAKDYLMDLVEKSLVLVARRGSDGGIKACRIHNLLHDLCLRKSEEENFLQQILKYDQVSSSSSSSCPIHNKQRRLCIRSHVFNYSSLMPSAPHVCSFLCFASKESELSHSVPLFICQALKLLTVLDLSSICISSFPRELVRLVLLRYLALWFENGGLPPSVVSLWNLETLILRTGISITLPNNIWKMEKLRHLIIRGGKNEIEYSYEGQIDDGSPLILDNLQTISQISPSPSLPYVLSRTPNLRKLGLCGPLESAGYLAFPDLHLLNHLETLKLFNTKSIAQGPFDLQYFLPQNVKRLTMSNTNLGWNQLSTLRMLPNLVVLKLLCHACIETRWETSGGGFRRLKFLKFHFIDIAQWSTDSSHFPSLEHLVLIACRKLEGIPSELGDIPTLQTIEVRQCSHLATNSALQMKEEQLAMGNNGLKFYIQDLEPTTIP